ncbi:MAG: tetratricopeptide repeat protein [Rhodanobacteraceae bacterium]
MSGRRDQTPDPRLRTEPVLGDVDRLNEPPRIDDELPPFSAEPRHRAARTDDLPPPFTLEPGRRPRMDDWPPRRSPWPWIAIVLALVVIGGGAWVWTHQNTLRDDLPRTQLNAVLARADSALAAGKLSGSPDSARDQYEAALALDPDSEHAIAGLRNVGQAELKRAQEDIHANRLDEARTALEEARGLLGGGDEVAQTESALNKAANRGTTADTLIDRANAALQAGHLEGKGGAADLFHRVLVSDPDNAVARHGMDRVGAGMGARVQDQLKGGDRAGAQRTLDKLASLLPTYAGLPDLRAAVAQADQEAKTQVEQHLAQGDTDLHAGKFTGEGDDNALAQFQAVLQSDPDNAQAHAGLGRVAQALVVQANAALDAQHPGEASKLLDAAAKLAPKSADLAAARSRLHTLASTDSQSDEEGTQGEPPPAVLSPAQSARVARLVGQADAAARKGELMLPPGDSAYDLYRAALAIDGNNSAAQSGLQALPQIARSLFSRSMQGGKLDRAGDLLATLAQLSPGDGALSMMQHNLGGAWLDRARTLADQGRYDDARRALDEARRLTPDDPRISEVDNRIGYGN